MVAWTENLCGLALPRIFSHTDSKLLTVTVFLEFTALYRTVQLILIKSSWGGGKGGWGKRGQGEEEGEEREFSEGRKKRDERPAEKKTGEKGNHEKFKEEKKRSRSAGAKVGCSLQTSSLGWCFHS